MNGVETLGGFTNVSYSKFAGDSGTAIKAEGSSSLSVEHSMLTSERRGGDRQRRVDRSPGRHSGVYDNLTGFGCGTGNLASTGDNRKGGNTGGPGPACSPNAVITVQ